MKLSVVRLAAKAVLLSATMIATISPANAQWENQVEITVRGEYRYILGNGIPNHETGQFPNRNNPNQIRPQRHQYRVPADPVVASQPTPMEGSRLELQSTASRSIPAPQRRIAAIVVFITRH